ncbi:MAG: hypothetical protein ABJN98_10305 [Roseibium sp.]
MTKRIHAIAGGLALFLIALFWAASLGSELFGTVACVVRVKTGILWGLGLLIPAMMAAGGSGAFLGRGWRSPVVSQKMRRMRIIAANGLLVLVPSAIYLAMKAQSGSFDSWFYGVQAIELAAGATNICLLALNMRDGLKLSRRRSAPAQVA